MRVSCCGFLKRSRMVCLPGVAARHPELCPGSSAASIGCAAVSEVISTSASSSRFNQPSSDSSLLCCKAIIRFSTLVASVVSLLSCGSENIAAFLGSSHPRRSEVGRHVPLHCERDRQNCDKRLFGSRSREIAQDESPFR